MRHYLLSALIIGSIAWHAIALPQSPSAAPSSNPTALPASSGTYSAQAATGTADVEETDRQENKKICVSYWPEKGDPLDEHNPDGVVQQCMGICGNMTQKTLADGGIHSVSCISHEGWQPADGGKPYPPDYIPGPGDPPAVQGGNCTCDNSFIDELANDFLEALPIIANIGCEIIMNAVGLVAQVGALAIPGVGEAIDGGMVASIQAAKLADYSYDASQDALGAFQNWLNPCGPSKLPDGVQKAFDIMSGIAPNRLPKGFTPPKGLPKGGGKPGDKGDPDPKKSAPASPSIKPSKSVLPAAASSRRPSKPASLSHGSTPAAKPTTKPKKKPKTRTAPTGTASGTASYGPVPSNGTTPARYRLSRDIKPKESAVV
ncbi:MAG: hypothetical protein Q9191_002327 [Dirinaria sp. TL-2023a]